jgi:hypothetical protein
MSGCQEFEGERSKAEHSDHYDNHDAQIFVAHVELSSKRERRE